MEESIVRRQSVLVESTANLGLVAYSEESEMRTINDRKTMINRKVSKPT